MTASRQIKKRATDEAFMVDQVFLADVLGVSDRTVRRMARDGMPQAARGRYDLRACVQWQLAQAGEKEQGDEMNPRDLLAIAQRERVELEIAQLRSTLIPQDLVSRTFNGVAAMIAGQLEGIGPRMAGELADIDDPAMVQARLTDEARSIRLAIAESLKDYGKAIEAELAAAGAD